MGFSGEADFVEDEKETVFTRELLVRFREEGFSRKDEDMGAEQLALPDWGAGFSRGTDRVWDSRMLFTTSESASTQQSLPSGNRPYRIISW